MQFSENWLTSLASPKSERKAWGSDWHFLSCDGWYEANGGKWEASSCWEPNHHWALTTRWPSSLSLCTVTFCASGNQPLLSICRQNSVRQCTIPPPPSGLCSERKNVFGTICVPHNTAVWPLCQLNGRCLDTVHQSDVHSNILFLFSKCHYHKSYFNVVFKTDQFELFKVQLYVHPYADVGSPVSFFPSPSFFLSHGTQLHSTISSYYTILSSETMCAGKNSLLLIFLINHSGFRFHFG